MSGPTLAGYRQEAEALLGALAAGDLDAAWRFKWMHPRFRGGSVTDVRAATLALDDAELVVARDHGFETWTALTEFTGEAAHEGPVARFEAAADAVVSGACGQTEFDAALATVQAPRPKVPSTRSFSRF